jgi:hypothetical protein
MLRQAEEGLGENHSGEQRMESAVAKGERIIAGELKRQDWKPEDLATRRKSDPEEVAIAMRLRRETTLHKNISLTAEFPSWSPPPPGWQSEVPGQMKPLCPGRRWTP